MVILPQLPPTAAPIPGAPISIAQSYNSLIIFLTIPPEVVIVPPSITMLPQLSPPMPGYQQLPYTPILSSPLPLIVVVVFWATLIPGCKYDQITFVEPSSRMIVASPKHSRHGFQSVVTKSVKMRTLRSVTVAPLAIETERYFGRLPVSTSPYLAT